MAYDEYFADRVRQVLSQRHIIAIEKRMMGGLCFMVNDKMCIGVDKDKQGVDRLMARLDPEIYEQQLTKLGAMPMDLTGKRMKGFVFVSAEGVDEDNDLEQWIALALEFNPRAKSSKKKPKK